MITFSRAVSPRSDGPRRPAPKLRKSVASPNLTFCVLSCQHELVHPRRSELEELEVLADHVDRDVPHGNRAQARSRTSPDARARAARDRAGERRSGAASLEEPRNAQIGSGSPTSVSGTGRVVEEHDAPVAAGDRLETRARSPRLPRRLGVDLAQQAARRNREAPRRESRRRIPWHQRFRARARRPRARRSRAAGHGCPRPRARRRPRQQRFAWKSWFPSTA
jgi:hypothetical protein